MRNPLFFLLTGALLLMTAHCSNKKQAARPCKLYQNGLQKLEYHHPGLIVDLDGGFKVPAIPFLNSDN